MNFNNFYEYYWNEKFNETLSLRFKHKYFLNRILNFQFFILEFVHCKMVEIKECKTNSQRLAF